MNALWDFLRSDLFLKPIPVLILLTTGWVMYDTYRVLQKQRVDAVVIDLAGRQRMLNQRYLSEVLLEANGASSGYDRTREVLAQTAIALKNGGEVPALREGLEKIFVPATEDREIATQLAEQAVLIGQLDVPIAGLLSDLKDQPLSPLNVEKLRKVFVLTEQIGKKADDAVRLMVDRSQEHVKAAFLRNALLAAMASLLSLWMIKLFRDRERTQRDLVSAREAAVRASEAKSQFLANMSHEIRTPMNAIIGMADLLMETALSREQRRYVDTFKRAGDTLLALINDILDLAKIESGQLQLEPADFDLTELVERVGEIMALRAHQKGLELICYVSQDFPPVLKGDANRLKEILINLLSNAIKFTSAGEVTLRADPEPASPGKAIIRFSVQDTGIGIPRDRLGAIFESFAQADSSIAYNYGGTGLGLAICKRLVELMNGRIWVQSQIGVGSTFSFTVELNESRATLTYSSQVSSEILVGKRVLIVDDNSTNRLILRKYLGKAATVVDEAESGSDALAMLRRAKADSTPYDFILLDYRMPGMNGIQVAETIRRENLASTTVAMLLSSDGNQGGALRLQEAGVAEYLVKPIRRNELFEAISQALHTIEGKVAKGASRDPLPILGEGVADQRLKVLLVDDVEENRFIICELLNESNVEIVEATNGREAVDKFRGEAENEPFGVVLMDMRMSVMDGYTATREIRKVERELGMRTTPVIALTAHALTEEVQKALQAGCTAHLAKPITKRRLVEVLSGYGLGRVAAPPEPKAPPVGEPIVVQVEPFLKKRIPKYLEDRQSELVLARNALDAGNLPMVSTFGHNLSGNAGIYGFTELGAMSHRLEKTAEAGNIEDARRLLAEIENYLGRIKAD